MAFSPIQHQNYGGGDSGPDTWAFPDASTAGTLLIVGVFLDNGPGMLTPPSGWTLLGSFATGNHSYLGLYYYPDNPGGITSFILPAGSYTFTGGEFGEFAGVAATSPVDQSAATYFGSSSSSGTVTAGGANAAAADLTIVLFGALGNSSGEAATITSSTPTLTLLDEYTAGEIFCPTGMFYGTSGSIGETDTASATFSSTDAWCGLIVTFSAAAPAPPAAAYEGLSWDHVWLSGASRTFAFFAGQQGISRQQAKITQLGCAISATTTVTAANTEKAPLATSITSTLTVTARNSPPAINALAGSGLSYFVDSSGKPKFLLADNPWGLIANAGAYDGSGGGTWQQDIDNYCNSRGSQGFTAIYFDPLSNEVNGGTSGTETWDGVAPFSSFSPVTFNSTYWQRVDYLVQGCARNGMTAWMNIGYNEDTSPGGDMNPGPPAGVLNGLNSTQFTAYGTGLATRYGADQNIIWAVGNDYGFAGGTGEWDTQYSEILSALRAASDSHLITIHPYAESDSRYDFGTGTTGETSETWGTNAQFSMVYTYIQTYFGVEYAYLESSPITVIWGDGYFYQGNAAMYDMATRQMFWWAAASGARGANTGSTEIWQWDSGSPAEVTEGLWWTTQAGVAIALIESLPEWYKLIPDTSNALITAGRGTRTTSTVSGGSGSQYGDATTDDYVAASLTPDGTLALIYFSAGCGSSSITINQSLLAAGYTATWVDPTTGTKTTGTPGSTYTPSTAVGNNAAEYADWVLVLQGSPATALTAPISASLAVTAADHEVVQLGCAISASAVVTAGNKETAPLASPITATAAVVANNTETAQLSSAISTSAALTAASTEQVALSSAISPSLSVAAICTKLQLISCGISSSCNVTANNNEAGSLSSAIASSSIVTAGNRERTALSCAMLSSLTMTAATNTEQVVLGSAISSSLTITAANNENVLLSCAVASSLIVTANAVETGAGGLNTSIMASLSVAVADTKAVALGSVLVSSSEVTVALNVEQATLSSAITASAVVTAAGTELVRLSSASAATASISATFINYTPLVAALTCSCTVTASASVNISKAVASAVTAFAALSATNVEAGSLSSAVNSSASVVVSFSAIGLSSSISAFVIVVANCSSVFSGFTVGQQSASLVVQPALGGVEQSLGSVVQPTLQ